MKQNWRSFLPIIILTLIGIGLIIYGLAELLLPKTPVVEIIKADKGASPKPSIVSQIVVDVAGAVENPGVYTLSLGARVSDALVAAGGLSITADKNYLSRNVNLASFVADGSKIYILKKGEAPATQVKADSSVPATITQDGRGSKISVNSASVGELDSLWGVGEVRAQSIVSNRPYASLEELKSKANIPENVYEAIKNNISL